MSKPENFGHQHGFLEIGNPIFTLPARGLHFIEIETDWYSIGLPEKVGFWLEWLDIPFRRLPRADNRKSFSGARKWLTENPAKIIKPGLNDVKNVKLSNQEGSGNPSRNPMQYLIRPANTADIGAIGELMEIFQPVIFLCCFIFHSRGADFSQSFSLFFSAPPLRLCSEKKVVRQNTETVTFPNNFGVGRGQASHSRFVKIGRK